MIGALVSRNPMVLIGIGVLVITALYGAYLAIHTIGYQDAEKDYKDREAAYLKALAEHQAKIQSQGDAVSETYRRLENEQIQARTKTDALIQRLREAEKERGDISSGSCHSLDSHIRLYHHIADNSGLPKSEHTITLDADGDSLSVLRITQEEVNRLKLKVNELIERVKLIPCLTE